jgi:hypothetical protein
LRIDFMGITDRRLATLWRHDEWRCEYWESQTGGALRLYMGHQLVESRAVDGIDETAHQASEWREAIGGARGYLSEPGASAIPVPDRRQNPANRRDTSRGGRRQTDRKVL